MYRLYLNKMFNIYRIREEITASIETHADSNRFWEELSSNTHDFAIELLRDYVEGIDWYKLCSNENPRITEILKKYPKNIDWRIFCSCPSFNAVHFLKQKYNNYNSKLTKDFYINTEGLCRNYNDKAVELLLKIYHNKINVEQDCFFSVSASANTNTIPAIELISLDYKELIKNKSNLAVKYCLEHRNERGFYDNFMFINMNSNDLAIDFLLDNQEYICYNLMCSNTNSRALELLEEVIDKLEKGIIDKDDPKYMINCSSLSENTCDKVFEILKKYPQYIDWIHLASNSNNIAISMIEKKLIDTNISENTRDAMLSKLYYNTNPKAVNILLKYNYRINYSNVGIIEIAGYNYDAIKQRMEIIKKELIEYVWHTKSSKTI